VVDAVSDHEDGDERAKDEAEEVARKDGRVGDEAEDEGEGIRDAKAEEKLQLVQRQAGRVGERARVVLQRLEQLLDGLDVEEGESLQGLLGAAHQSLDVHPWPRPKRKKASNQEERINSKDENQREDNQEKRIKERESRKGNQGKGIKERNQENTIKERQSREENQGKGIKERESREEIKQVYRVSL